MPASRRFASLLLGLAAVAAGCDDSTSSSASTDARGPGRDAQLNDSTAAGRVDSQVGDGGSVSEAFRRFRLSWSYGPCPPEGGDCSEAVEVSSSRVLIVDRNELPVVLRHARLSDEDYHAIRAALVDPDLIALLATPDALCPPVVDLRETMTLELEGAAYSKETSACAQPALAAARALLEALAARYFPSADRCTCAGGCLETERCLQSQGGGLGPSGPECAAPTGLAECRPTCSVQSAALCPSERPHCVTVELSAGCCSDANESVRVCCANADASDHTNCR